MRVIPKVARSIPLTTKVRQLSLGFVAAAQTVLIVQHGEKEPSLCDPGLTAKGRQQVALGRSMDFRVVHGRRTLEQPARAGH